MTTLLLAALLSQAPVDAPLVSAPVDDEPAAAAASSAGVELRPREEPYVGQDVPDNARVVRTNNDGLILTGLLVGGLPYAVSAGFALTLGVILAATGDLQMLAWAIPLAGPFLSMTLIREGNSNRQSLLWIHGINGGLQVAGVALLAVGYLTRRTVLVYDEPAELSLAPVLLGDGGGLALRMRL